VEFVHQPHILDVDTPGTLAGENGWDLLHYHIYRTKQMVPCRRGADERGKWLWLPRRGPSQQVLSIQSLKMVFVLVKNPDLPPTIPPAMAPALDDLFEPEEGGPIGELLADAVGAEVPVDSGGSARNRRQYARISQILGWNILVSASASASLGLNTFSAVTIKVKMFVIAGAVKR